MAVRRSYRFAVVPEWVLFHDALQPVDVRVFAVLDRYAQGGVAWPGLATIGSLAQCSEDTARRAIRRLEAVGAVTVEQVMDENGRQRSNRYHLAGDAPMPNRGGTAATPEGGTDARGEGGAAATQKREVKTERSRNETTPGDARTGASLVALAAPSSDIAIRELVPQVLDEAAAQAKALGAPLLPSQRMAVAKTVLEALQHGYSREDIATAVASARFRTHNGVLGQLGQRRDEPQSVGNRGMRKAVAWANEGESA